MTQDALPTAVTQEDGLAGAHELGRSDAMACGRSDAAWLGRERGWARQAQAWARQAHEEELALLRELARIPAPTGDEGRRAAFVADWLRAQGARRVEVTPERNVCCWLGDGPDDPRPLRIFAAHLDIVAPDTEPLPLAEDDERLYAPGVGDDTANLVGLLMATKYLLAHPEALAGHCQTLVVADAGEEGLGNLAGVKGLFGQLAARGAVVEEFVTFDLYLPQCISTAVGSHRFRISAQTTGGHSYLDFGRPNAIERLCGLVVRLAQDPLPAGLDAPVTHNMGTISGGTSVNAIAADAELLYEYRSTSETALQAMRARLEALLDEARGADADVAWTCEELGVRPGNGPVDPGRLAALVSRATAAIEAITGEPADQAPASTDANVPLSLGVPALCVGAVRGALLHTREEWIEKESLADGLALILTLMSDGYASEPLPATISLTSR